MGSGKARSPARNMTVPRRKENFSTCSEHRSQAEGGRVLARIVAGSPRLEVVATSGVVDSAGCNDAENGGSKALSDETDRVPQWGKGMKTTPGVGIEGMNSPKSISPPDGD